MKLFFFAFIIFGASGNATAEWNLIGAPSDNTLYVDTSTARPGDARGFVRVWVMHDLKLPRKIDGYGAYLSAKFYEQFDCPSEKHRIVSSVFYSGNKGSGEVVATLDDDRATWQPLVPYTMSQLAWRVMCPALR